ncbi:MAG: PIN domain-containing protein [Terrimicrobiaceae bacterium]
MPASIHLDTNYLIQFAGGQDLRLVDQVTKWLGDGIPLHASAMAWAEFRCGPLDEKTYLLVAEITSGILPVTFEIANKAGDLFEATGRRSRSLADCIIAATAMSKQAPLATNNRTDFEPFIPEGLELI